MVALPPPSRVDTDKVRIVFVYADCLCLRTLSVYPHLVSVNAAWRWQRDHFYFLARLCLRGLPSYTQPVLSPRAVFLCAICFCLLDFSVSTRPFSVNAVFQCQRCLLSPAWSLSTLFLRDSSSFARRVRCVDREHATCNIAGRP
jgi:hypothetical protein